MSNSLRMLSCREDLAVLQEMLVMVGVRHLIRNVLSSSQLERVENMLSKFSGLPGGEGVEGAGVEDKDT